MGLKSGMFKGLKSWNDTIVDMNFRYVHPSITSANFPDIGEVRGKPSLCEIKKERTISEIEKVMVKKGLLLANLRELLTYAENGWDGRGLCVALGSLWVLPDGNRYAPALDGYGNKRDLVLDWVHPGVRWYETYNLVVVSQ